jgi:hypothetical protein
MLKRCKAARSGGTRLEAHFKKEFRFKTGKRPVISSLAKHHQTKIEAG